MKIAIFTFNGEMMCFAHALFAAIDMEGKGHDVRIVIEGSSTALIGSLAKKENPFNRFYTEVKDKGLIEGVCKACAAKMGSLEDVKAEGLELLGDVYGHPSIEKYISEGYEVITL